MKTELKKLGAAKVYKWLSEKYSDKCLPVCYYLCPLEGALQNKHWSDLTEKEKTKLRISAGLSK